MEQAKTNVKAAFIFKMLQSGVNSYNFSNHDIEDDLFLDVHANEINFSNSHFHGPVHLNAPSSTTTLNFSNAKFNKAVNLEISTRATLDFRNAIINNGLVIKGKDRLHLLFSGCSLKGEIRIEGCTLGKAMFDKVIFSEHSEDYCFSFEENTCEIASFKDARLTNAVFNNTVFHSNVSFDGTKLAYTKLPATGNFFDTEFKRNAYFNQTDFDKGAFFNGAKFEGTTIFVGANKSNACIGDFSGAKFHGRSFFDYSKFDSVTFNNCEFGDVASFKDVVYRHLEISKSFFSRGADFLNAIIRDGDRETFRIIKNEFLKINNGVEALHYRAKEMVAYEKEIRLRKSTSEYFMLWLNKVSNNHGLNWSRGLLFTIIVAILFYFLYLSSLQNLPFNWGWHNWQSFWSATGQNIKYFIRFIIVTHDLDFMKDFEPSALSFVVDFIAKIFIGYGVYQTIQAFRKYGKS